MSSACLQQPDVEAREVHQLDDGRVGQQQLEVRALVSRTAERGRDDLHQVRDPVTGREAAPGTAGRGCQSRPIASVSTATTGPSETSGGRSPTLQGGWWRWGRTACSKWLTPNHATAAVVPRKRLETFTTLRPQVPETCASTNSATWACTACGWERRCSGPARGRQCPAANQDLPIEPGGPDPGQHHGASPMITQWPQAGLAFRFLARPLRRAARSQVGGEALHVPGRQVVVGRGPGAAEPAEPADKEQAEGAEPVGHDHRHHDDGRDANAADCVADPHAARW